MPPLNALRAFECAARHLSVSLAADDLGVTPGAVSQHIRALEEWFGLSLFERVPRGLALTEAGHRLYPRVAEGFGLIADAVDAVSTTRDRNILTVGVAPAMASKWLVPRLTKFNALHPEMDLRLAANYKLVDFRRDGFDAAIRFGFGRYGNNFVRKLFDDGVVPLCSPKLLEGHDDIAVPGDLRRFTLIHDTSVQIFDPEAPTWDTWFEAAGAAPADTSGGLSFDHAELAFTAALAGSGVLLGRRVLAQADLDAGRLVMPFDLVLPFGLAYYFVCPREFERERKIQIFLKWLEDELAATFVEGQSVPFVEDRLPPHGHRQA